MTVNFMRFGKTICRLREMRHMTQEELASELEISSKTLSKIEHGADCRLSVAAQIAAVLQVPLVYLLSDAQGVYLTNQKRKEAQAHLKSLMQILNGQSRN